MSDPSLDRRREPLAPEGTAASLPTFIRHVGLCPTQWREAPHVYYFMLLLQEESCRGYRHPVLQACYDASGLKVQMYIIFSE